MTVMRFIPNSTVAACILGLSAAVSGPGSSHAADIERRDDLIGLFTEAGTDGTMVVHQISGDRYWVVNGERATEAFAPSSTFKIPNTLIALQSGAVSGMDEQFPYGGEPFLVDGRPFLPEVCNADITLETALQNSCIPVYQELARRIGVEGYRRFLVETAYGAGSITAENLETFWLDGGVEISALQQVAFFDALLTGDTVFSPENVDLLADALHVPQIEGAEMVAKTGYVFMTDPAIGWYVGWLEVDGKTYTFALNLDISEPDHSKARSAIALQVLSGIGVYSPGPQ